MYSTYKSLKDSFRSARNSFAEIARSSDNRVWRLVYLLKDLESRLDSCMVSVQNDLSNKVGDLPDFDSQSDAATTSSTSKSKTK